MAARQLIFRDEARDRILITDCMIASAPAPKSAPAQELPGGPAF